MEKHKVWKIQYCWDGNIIPTFKFSGRNWQIEF